MRSQWYGAPLMKRIASAALLFGMAGCGRVPAGNGTFGDDVAFLKKYTNVITLASNDGSAHIAVAPFYQGRVMTSTAAGPEGDSYGYIHRAGVAAAKAQPHMTVLGGEDRFWLGPEGGQYALYFPPGAAFDADHWQVPAPIDWDAWPVTSQNAAEVSFQRDMTLTNYSGTTFSMRVNRTVRLLDRTAAATALGGSIAPATRMVAYESQNRLTNIGRAPWKKDSGLISIWILGMYRPAPNATVVVPFVPPQGSGPIVNDAYFGKIDGDRLKIGEGVLFFKADGQKRGKIGLPKGRAKDVAGSYDPDRHLLTVVRFSLPAAPDYVNSMWAKQENPYGGDVINSYNDGPMAPGAAPLGPFYEIESSSPAVALEPQQFITHVHRTFHFQGPEAELDAIAQAQLGVSLAQIRAGLAPKIAR